MKNSGIDSLRDQVVKAALPHVVFDGWSETTLDYAIQDTGLDSAMVHLAFPRKGIDLALAYHEWGDRQMSERLHAHDMQALRYRDRVALAIWERLAVADKEAVRKGSALFALPQNISEGSRAIWATSDAIWNALGDHSDDLNWYTKRMTLSAVYSSVVLFWLGDESEDHHESKAFIDRRIDDVMQFEKFKAQVKNSPPGKLFESSFGRVFSMIKKPGYSQEK